MFGHEEHRSACAHHKVAGENGGPVAHRLTAAEDHDVTQGAAAKQMLEDTAILQFPAPHHILAGQPLLAPRPRLLGRFTQDGDQLGDKRTVEVSRNGIFVRHGLQACQMPIRGTGQVEGHLHARFEAVVLGDVQQD
jgi:hypothetical protein